MNNSKFSPITRSWQAYRFNNLVYFRNFKCASCFYLDLFENILHWEKISINDINWNNDHVFSYIRDPFERRISGLAEYVCRMYREKNSYDYNHDKFLELLNHPYFVRIIADTFVLDDHSLPIYNILGINAELVDWIPIDVNAIDHVKLTTKLLKSYNIEITQGMIDKITATPQNVSYGYKKEFINQLKSCATPNLVISDLDYDSILYSHVVSFITPSQDTWKKISWLKFNE